MRETVRVLAVVACACSPSARPPLTGHASEVIDAHVLGPTGPVANALVEVVALRPHGCPCGSRPEGWWVGSDCRCPAALAMWRGALEHCARPAVLAVARADERGQVAVPVISGSTLLASGPPGARRFALPELRTELAFELAALRSPRIHLAGDPRGLRAAVVFDDGYCVPLRPRGDAWEPERPFPEDASGVIVAENRDGLTAMQLSVLDDDEPLSIYPTRAVAGTCSSATSAVLDGAFQHLVAPVDRSGRFRFARVLGFDAEIQCRKVDGVSERLIYQPEDGSVSSTLGPAPCIPVEVVGGSGEPIAGAQLIGGFSRARYLTDEHGRGCLSELGDVLEAFAPGPRGGRCAGRTRLTVTELYLLISPSPVRLTLEIRPLPLVAMRGRVLSRDRLPVAGATVDVERLAPAEVAGCVEPDAGRTTTALDGSFTLTVPRGELALGVRHPWYVDQQLAARDPGPQLAIVLERGATWEGRVLDPDGAVIERCKVWLERNDQPGAHASCSASGFALTRLPPGPATLVVEVEHHPILGDRRLHLPVTIAVGERRLAELRWPPGAVIAGTIVDRAGAPIAGGRLKALPVGVAPDLTRTQRDQVNVKADAQGRFVFHHLNAGGWTLYPLATGTFQAQDASTGTIDVRVVVPR